jgi:hypothetical protein
VPDLFELLELFGLLGFALQHMCFVRTVLQHMCFVRTVLQHVRILRTSAMQLVFDLHRWIRTGTILPVWFVVRLQLV